MYFFNSCAFCTQKPSIIFGPKFQDSKTENGRVAQRERERERDSEGASPPDYNRHTRTGAVMWRGSLYN